MSIAIRLEVGHEMMIAGSDIESEPEAYYTGLAAFGLAIVFVAGLTVWWFGLITSTKPMSKGWSGSPGFNSGISITAFALP